MGLFSSSKPSKAPAPARSPGSAGQVRRADLTAVPAGPGWTAVRVRRGPDEASLWPSYAIDFLAACDEFRTLPEQLRKYGAYHDLPAEQMRELHAWAGEMAAGGLLVGAETLVDRVRAQAAPEEAPARIEAIGIPSGGNEARLRRVVTSFARNAREHGREVAFTVATNCNPQKMQEVRALCSQLSAETRARIELLGEEEKQSFARRLAQAAGVEEAAAIFALCDPCAAGFACGANRNVLLLRQAGRPFLSLDDDVSCEMVAAPEPVENSPGLTFFSSRDAFERWFYSRYDEAFAGRDWVQADYLGLHEKLLGRSVGGLLRGAESPAAVDFLCITDAMLRRLQETSGRVVTTFTGHLGHPGVPTSYYYLTYRRADLKRLTQDGEAAYRARLGSASVCALVPRPAIADASLSPGMAIGIDARTLIPPFPPVLHAEDFVWGAAVWQSCAAGFAGHLPVALRHDPGTERRIIAPPLNGVPPVAIWEFAHILRALLLGWMAPPGEEDTAVRLDLLGRHLCEIGGAPAGQFQEFLRDFVLQHESDKIAYAQECLSEETSAPDFWRQDVEEYLEQTRQALAAPDFDIPFDLREKWTPGEARVLMQRLIFEYGRLLHAWPALFAAAARLDFGGEFLVR